MNLADKAGYTPLHFAAQDQHTDAARQPGVASPDPAPVTTIAWRLSHLAVGVFGPRVSCHRKALHHLAEVSLLRDLYRATGGARLA